MLHKRASEGKMPLEARLFSVCGWLCGQRQKPEFKSSRIVAESKENIRFFRRKADILWSCWADSNWRPHPYQLIGRIGFAAFRPFCTLFAPGCHPFRNSCVHCLRPLVSPCGSACGSKAAASQPLLLRRNQTVTSLPHPTGSGRGSEPLRSHRTVFCGRLRRR